MRRIGMTGKRPTENGTPSVTRPRVVLAEDHPAMATELHELLASEYDIVAVVQDGAALVEAALSYVPDAIVCDIAMPRVSGLAAAVAILGTTPDARIVFVTVQDSRAVVGKAFSSAHEGTCSSVTQVTSWLPRCTRRLPEAAISHATFRAILDTPGRFNRRRDARVTMNRAGAWKATAGDGDHSLAQMRPMTARLDGQNLITSAVRKTVSSPSFRASAEPITSFEPPDDSVRKRSSPEPGIPSGLITSTNAMTSRSDSSAGSCSYSHCRLAFNETRLTTDTVSALVVSIE
jgi:CheY-like chemotaxis protein